MIAGLSSLFTGMEVFLFLKKHVADAAALSARVSQARLFVFTVLEQEDIHVQESFDKSGFCRKGKGDG